MTSINATNLSAPAPVAEVAKPQPLPNFAVDAAPANDSVTKNVSDTVTTLPPVPAVRVTLVDSASLKDIQSVDNAPARADVAAPAVSTKDDAAPEARPAADTAAVSSAYTAATGAYTAAASFTAGAAAGGARAVA